MKKILTVSKEGTLMKSGQSCWNHQGWCYNHPRWEGCSNGSSQCSTEKILKEVVINIEMECNVFKSTGKAPMKHLLIFLLPLEESDPDLFILCVKQS